MSFSPPTSDSAPIPPRHRFWFDRNWKWTVPLVVFAGLLCVAGLLYGVESMIRSSYPFRSAVKRATESPAVAAKLGTPLHFGWFATGNVNFNGSEGNAGISVPISGPTAKGRLVTVAHKHANVWSFETMEVDVEGEPANVIPLLENAAVVPVN